MQEVDIKSQIIVIYGKNYVAKILKGAMLRAMTNNIEHLNIFAVTDCHQEARNLCCLLSEIINRTDDNEQNTLVCDGGDLFKGIYDKQLCINSYLQLRRKLPQSKIVLAVGNNDFGFNINDLNFLKSSIQQFNFADIHVLCANLIDEKTGACPTWLNQYVLLNMCGKKIMVTAFCINQIRLQKYGLKLLDIEQTFQEMAPKIKQLAPDALIVLNHALTPKSLALVETAEKSDVKIDLLIGGHEHSSVPYIIEKHIYYPEAYTRNMLQFKLDLSHKPAQLQFIKSIDCKSCNISPDFENPLKIYEADAGLNVPVAHSVLNLERNYSDPSPIGTFLTDKMRAAAKADIALISTGFICHALRFEPGKILTYYNVERAFSADTPLQTVIVTAKDLYHVFNNAIHNRYTQYSGNTRFLQCSQNIALDCMQMADKTGRIKQIYINGEALLDDNGKPLYPQDTYVCALDPFVASGEQGFDALRPLAKETLLKSNKLVKIKDLLLEALTEAEAKYAPGSSYPTFKLRDL